MCSIDTRPPFKVIGFVKCLIQLLVQSIIILFKNAAILLICKVILKILQV